MKPNKQNTRKLISDVQLNLELKTYFENSITDKTNLYELIRTKYRIGKQRCLNAYDLAIEEWRILKEKATNEQIVDSTKESLKKAILSKNQILERLSEIGIGKVNKIARKSIPPSYSEQIQAMKTINEMQGYKAPIKSEQKINMDLNDNLSFEEREKRIKELYSKMQKSI